MSDNWQPSASPAVLKLRARMLKRLRAFFDARDVLEVETPLLCRAATTEPHLHSVKTCTGKTLREHYYLHTSPELAMKRLLAAGSGDIYQICKVLRDGETGPRHNPEFTLIEWYRTGLSLERLIAETVDLIKTLLKGRFDVQRVKTYSYRELFVQYLDIDPFEASGAELSDVFERETGQSMYMDQDEAGNDAWLDLLLSHLIEPRLPARQLTVVTAYPASQASLAKLNDSDPRLARRFECYVGAMELANGFEELIDVNEQRRRMEQDINERKQRGMETVPLDERFLAALEHGLPECCGVAVGFDRLVMLAAGADDIREVLAFPIDRA